MNETKSNKIVRFVFTSGWRDRVLRRVEELGADQIAEFEIIMARSSTLQKIFPGVLDHMGRIKDVYKLAEQLKVLCRTQPDKALATMKAFSQILAIPSDVDDPELIETESKNLPAPMQPELPPPIEAYLDETRSILKINHNYCDLTDRGLELLKLLIDADHQRVPVKNIETKMGVQRPDKIIDRQPEPVQALIDRGGKNGYRIKLHVHITSVTSV